jgi:hypothetical protein
VHRVALCFVGIAISRHGVTVAMVVTTTAVRGGGLFTDSRGFAWLSENDFTPAWKSLRSWYVVARNDEAIAPDAERPVRVADAVGGAAH